MRITEREELDRAAAISAGMEKMKEFFSKRLTPERVRVYQEKLKGFPTTVIEVAFRKAKEQRQHFPSPSELSVLAMEEMPSRRRFVEKPTASWRETHEDYDVQFYEFASGCRQIRIISKNQKRDEQIEFGII
jgi:hypothetical protein